MLKKQIVNGSNCTLFQLLKFKQIQRVSYLELYTPWHNSKGTNQSYHVTCPPTSLHRPLELSLLHLLSWNITRKNKNTAYNTHTNTFLAIVTTLLHIGIFRTIFERGEKEKKNSTYFIVILPFEGEKRRDEFWSIGLRHNSRIH